MAYTAEIIADSVNWLDQRLTTFEITVPRIVLAEFNTHRIFSRNSASSRAIPVEKQITRVLDDPFMPINWGVNQSGMQANSVLPAAEAIIADDIWRSQSEYAILGAVALIGGVKNLKDENLRDRISDIKRSFNWVDNDLPTPVHKQIANRLLEPFSWHQIIVTATDWNNFYALRANPQAQPEIQKVAYMMKDLYENSSPKFLTTDQWHMPLIQEDEMDMPIDMLKKISVGRCTRVSYLTHHGVRDFEEDIKLHDRLVKDGHMSPLEHVAQPMSVSEYRESKYSGNFHGWNQYRKSVNGESDFSILQKIYDFELIFIENDRLRQSIVANLVGI
jgi:thymidylate synthase ThyX